MERRVVITGLWRGDAGRQRRGDLLGKPEGRERGITKITVRFLDYKAHVAAEVKDFDPLLYMDKGELRKTTCSRSLR